MDIVKIPKKLRDIFDTLRNGQIEIGLEQLSKIKGFEPQKAIVLAEINYFSKNHEIAMTNDENGCRLTNNGMQETYYLNIFLHIPIQQLLVTIFQEQKFFTKLF